MTIPPAMTEASAVPLDGPDIQISVRQVFGIDTDSEAPAFSQVS